MQIMKHTNAIKCHQNWNLILSPFPARFSPVLGQFWAKLEFCGFSYRAILEYYYDSDQIFRAWHNSWLYHWFHASDYDWDWVQAVFPLMRNRQLFVVNRCIPTKLFPNSSNEKNFLAILLCDSLPNRFPFHHFKWCSRLYTAPSGIRTK